MDILKKIIFLAISFLIVLPASANNEPEVLTAHYVKACAILKESNKKMEALASESAIELEKELIRLTKEGKLEEAIAVRNQKEKIKSITLFLNGVKTNTGDSSADNKKILYKIITGSAAGKGYVWGSDIYTSDSSIERAAVHSGVLKDNETGEVKITMLPGQESYEGSDRNGVKSRPYGKFSGGMKIEKVDFCEEYEPGFIREKLALLKNKILTWF